MKQELPITLTDHNLAWAHLDLSEHAQRRLAHDLHDGVCQSLAGASLLAQVLSKALTGHPNARDAQELGKTLAGIVQEVQILFQGLYPAELETSGLLSALEQFIKSVTISVPVVLHRPEQIQSLNAAVKLHLFRLTQEALHNALAHAKASRIDISLREDTEALHLEVRDDGVGFDPALLEQDGPTGLATIRYRARVLGATLHIVSSSGKGTSVQCRLPKTLQESD